MTDATTHFDERLRTFLRIAPWIGAAGLLAAPAIAMRFTTEVNWNAFDFAAAGVMLLAVLVPWELAARKARSLSGLFAVAVALGTPFLIVWSALAVGIVGSENNPANLAFFAVIGVFVLAALVAAFRPAGMVWATLAAAAAQIAVGAWAYLGGAGAGSPSWPMDVLGATGVFTFLWLLSAALFRRAALGEREA